MFATYNSLAAELDSVGYLMRVDNLKNMSLCRASLINKEFIITNSHCAKTNSNLFVFIPGNASGFTSSVIAKKAFKETSIPLNLAQINADVTILQLQKPINNITPLEVDFSERDNKEAILYSLAPGFKSQKNICKINLGENNLLKSKNCILPRGNSGSPFLTNEKNPKLVGLYSGWVEAGEQKMGIGSQVRFWPKVILDKIIRLRNN
jgi:Trypsin.